MLLMRLRERCRPSLTSSWETTVMEILLLHYLHTDLVWPRLDLFFNLGGNFCCKPEHKFEIYRHPLHILNLTVASLTLTISQSIHTKPRAVLSFLLLNNDLLFLLKVRWDCCFFFLFSAQLPMHSRKPSTPTLTSTGKTWKTTTTSHASSLLISSLWTMLISSSLPLSKKLPEGVSHFIPVHFCSLFGPCLPL